MGLSDDGNISVCSVSENDGFSKSLEIMKLDKPFPYNVTVSHVLTETHKHKRLCFCSWASQKISCKSDWLPNIPSSDESNRSMNGHVNWQTSVFGLRIGISSRFLIGPLFF